MRRRLYYLLPNNLRAKQVAEDLKSEAIPSQDIHVLTENNSLLKDVVDTHTGDETDRDYLIEWVLWRINLTVFFFACVSLITLLLMAPSYWILLPLTIIGITLSLGLMFAMKIPHIHLDEFKSAVKHGEVLMMVDVPFSGVGTLARTMHKQHPEAITGGVSWAL
ncbi:MAG: hypothetical protein OQK73_07595 [Gammaproteobacteria bacterium]|nr:hypothetical protein [Gammaproteobacteria bacterium]